MANGILEQILANQLILLNHFGIISLASNQVVADAAAEITQPSNIAGNTPANIAPPAAGAEVDAAGMPWDERIHSSSKEKVVKGNTWKYKRGVADALKLQVEAEHRAAGFGTPAPVAAPEAAIPPAVTPPPAADTALGLPGGLGLPGAVVTPPAPVKVQMPEYQAGAEITDTLLTTIASAFYAEFGEANFTRVMTELFKLPAGEPVTKIASPEHRDSFWKLVTTPAYLEHYQIIRPQA